MEINKSHKYIYYFIRYTLILHPFIILFLIVSSFIELPWDISNNMVVRVIIFVPWLISFLILPGIIYNGEYKHSLHGFGKNQFRYDIFCATTLGFGPMYVFFKKYNPVLKEYFKNNR